MQLKGLTGTYRRHCVVTELNKFKGGISVAEVMELAEALSVNTILTDLSLESNLEEGAGLSIGRAPPLSLLLGQGLAIGQPLSVNTTPTKLNLSKNRLRDSGKYMGYTVLVVTSPQLPKWQAYTSDV